MVAYHYDFRIALVKGSPNTVAANATVLVYDPLDTGYTTPLSVYSDPALTTIVNLVTDEYGIVPDFWTDNKPDLLWTSGTMKGGWATTSSRPGIRGPSGGTGPVGPMGPMGTPGLNGVGTNADVATYVVEAGPTRDALDEVTAGRINTPGTLTRGALDALFVGTGELATYAGDYGVLDPTGATDMSPVLQAGMDATPDGGTFLIPPGNYRVNTPIVSTGKSINVASHGVELTYYGATGNALQLTGSWGDIFSVSSVTSGTVVVDNVTIPTVNLAVTGTPPYKIGDVIKLVADDALPGARPATGSNVARVGQFLVVHSVASGVVRCIADGLIDPFTTNIRLAKLNPVTCSIDGLTVTLPSSSAGTGRAGLISISEMMNPVLSNVTCVQSGGQAITVASCYGYAINDCTVGYATNDSANGIYGYGIADNTSSFGRVRGLNARDVRHAFTTNTNQTAANTGLVRYGRTYGAVISDSVAHSTSGASFDTHNDGQEVRFVNCASYDSGNVAFSLRGRKNSVIACRAIRARTGLYVFSEDGMDGDSWGHTIDNLVIDSPRHQAINFFLNKASNTMETRPTNIGAITVINAPKDSLAFTNATVRIRSLSVIAKDLTGNTERLMVVNRSAVSIGTMSLDFTAQTSPVTGLLAGTLLNTATLRADDLKVQFGTQAVVDKFAQLFDTSGGNPGTVTNTLQVDKGTLDYYRIGVNLIPWADSHPDTYVNYQVLKMAALTSSYIYFSTTLTGTPVHQLGRTTDKAITMAGTITAATNLPALRVGRYAGQSVYICNLNGSGTLTVRNGATYNLLTKTGADVALAPGSSITIIWDGTYWRQIA